MFVDKTRSTGDPTKRKDSVDEEDDDRTVNRSGSGKNGREMVETAVKWCITSASDAGKAKETLTEILTIILQAYNDEVIIIDHKAREFTVGDPETMSDTIRATTNEGKIPIFIC